LVHWVPIIHLDKKGNGSLQFYNPDVPGEYVIIIEGITKDGKIGYQEKIYTLKN
jgi:uncharacterized protein YfaS (alpha-2-macroglobulin family)